MYNLTILFTAIVSIYDADTFRVNLPCDYPLVCHAFPIRATGYDAPEIRGKCPEEKEKALRAKEFVRATLSKSHKIELRNIKRGDRYFRLLAEVWVDGKPLADLVIKEGLARAYGGEKRNGWCPTVTP